MAKKPTRYKNLFKRGKVWWVRYHINGKRICKSLRTTVLVEAQFRGAEVMREAGHPNVPDFRRMAGAIRKRTMRNGAARYYAVMWYMNTQIYLGAFDSVEDANEVLERANTAKREVFESVRAKARAVRMRYLMGDGLALVRARSTALADSRHERLVAKLATQVSP